MEKQLAKKDEEHAEQLAREQAKSKQIQEELEQFKQQSAPLASPSSNQGSMTRIAS